MRIDGAGNVGIGTTEPDTMLTAYKASAGVGIIPQLKLWTNASANDGTEGSSIDFVASGDKTAVGSRILATRVAAGAHMDLRFHTQRDVEQMRITSTGNVGIGTTSPGAKLEVKQTSNVEALLIDNNGTDMSLHITQDGVLAVGKKALYVYSNASHVNAATSLVRFHQDGDSSTMPAAEIYNDGTGNTLSLISYGNGVTQELDNRGTNHGLYLIQGAVLASNKYSLYVYSNAVQVNSPLVKFVQDHASSDQTTLYIDNDGTGYGLIVDGGNVGIGTTSPGQLLHVNGNKATNFIAKVENTNADNGWGLQVQSGSDSGDYNLHLKNKADTQVLFWVKGDGTAYHNGNVGIGTTNPTSKLYVSGNIYTTGNCSALSFTDRTPYPKDLETAYASVFSMERLPDGKYDENNKERQLEHSKLHPFIKAGNGRDLSATVSAQNEVIKSLVKRIESLEATIEEMRQ